MHVPTVVEVEGNWAPVAYIPRQLVTSEPSFVLSRKPTSTRLPGDITIISGAKYDTAITNHS